MKVMPIRYVRDVDAATRFYRVLGLEPSVRQRGGGWVELEAAAGMRALHHSERGSGAEVSFLATEPLEDVVRRLVDAEFVPDGIVDENFGRSVRVVDPDGATVQINEHDEELYT